MTRSLQRVFAAVLVVVALLAVGGGKLTIYPATADSVAIDGGVELESPHAAEVTCIAFSADGALMASSDKRSAGGNIALCARTLSLSPPTPASCRVRLPAFDSFLCCATVSWL